MANKHQVLELLAKGLTPQEIAAKLKCSDGYVRATRNRKFGRQKETERQYYTKPEVRKKNADRYRKRYHTDTEFRERRKAYGIAYYRNKIESEGRS